MNPNDYRFDDISRDLTSLVHPLAMQLTLMLDVQDIWHSHSGEKGWRLGGCISSKAACPYP